MSDPRESLHAICGKAILEAVLVLQGARRLQVRLGDTSPGPVIGDVLYHLEGALLGLRQAELILRDVPDEDRCEDLVAVHGAEIRIE